MNLIITSKSSNGGPLIDYNVIISKVPENSSRELQSIIWHSYKHSLSIEEALHTCGEVFKELKGKKKQSSTVLTPPSNILADEVTILAYYDEVDINSVSTQFVEYLKDVLMSFFGYRHLTKPPQKNLNRYFLYYMKNKSYEI